MDVPEGASPGMMMLGMAAGGPPAGAVNGAGGPPAVPQLPPQMFTTAAQLLDLTDKRLVVVLRDGRKLFGMLRSWDQFGMPILPPLLSPPAPPFFSSSLLCTNHRGLVLSANLVLQSTTERIFIPPPSPSAPGLFTDIQRGVFLVRGENVLLLGEIDMDAIDEGPGGLEAPPRGYERAPLEVVQAEARRLRDRERDREARKNKKLAEIGFEGELGAEAIP
ncbi:hypothetical protein TD95_002209 [Thielaviopsis punctulata]|uniref:U6 snRNA-associated Sm-like protein LSm1 n=1 Tax=Thielaviopsis punctulata TaxID=72032 RepID=A0A0F4ZI22_9PEZI|nr:hypothetical protein TD95_002209 [Thielaviopsis punctulata]